MTSNSRDCPPVSKITHNKDGSTTVNFVDGNELIISQGFQADCIDGKWIIVPQLGPPPSPSPIPNA